jgi:hypothetical protein
MSRITRMTPRIPTVQMSMYNFRKWEGRFNSFQGEHRGGGCERLKGEIPGEKASVAGCDNDEVGRGVAGSIAD